MGNSTINSLMLIELVYYEIILCHQLFNTLTVNHKITNLLRAFIITLTISYIVMTTGYLELGIF